MNRIESFFRRNPGRLTTAESALQLIALYGILGFALNGIAVLVLMTYASRSIADPQILVGYTLQLACALMALELACLIAVGILYPRFDRMVARIEADPPAGDNGGDNLRNASGASASTNSGANKMFAPFQFLTLYYCVFSILFRKSSISLSV
jgi:hypothetical protein